MRAKACTDIRLDRMGGECSALDMFSVIGLVKMFIYSECVTTRSFPSAFVCIVGFWLALNSILLQYMMGLLQNRAQMFYLLSLVPVEAAMLVESLRASQRVL